MRTTDSQISFADLEFMPQRVQLDPTLQAVAAFIDTAVAIVDRVRRDRERGLTTQTPRRRRSRTRWATAPTCPSRCT